MSDDQVPTKWGKVESLMRRGQQSVTTGLPIEAPLAKLEAQTEQIRQRKLDLIGRWKAGGIQRHAALQNLRAMYDAQMAATSQALDRALQVEKQRVDLIAQKYLYEITQEYLGDMDVLGLRNVGARMETLLKLNDEMARLLEKAQGQDVPEMMKESTVKAIHKKYNEFFQRLVAEEPHISP